MRKIIPLLLLFVSAIAFVPSALANTSTISFNITNASSTLQSCINTPLKYEIATITATVGGDYTFTMQNVSPWPNDPLVNIYLDGNFTTTNLCTNRVGAAGPSFSSTLTLTAGQKVQLVGIDTGSIPSSFDLEITSPAPVQVVSLTTTGDPDGDGIPNSRDNCPHDFNPDQEDGWGSAMGDLCDTDWYNRTGNGLSGFEQKDGRFHLHGNCIYLADGAPRCPVIGDFDPSAFTPDAMPLTITSDEAGEWSVVVHYLHSNHGYPVYQVNVYSSNPPQPDTLVDDRLEFHVQTDGSWQWHLRGGLDVYNGI